jgi:hypothetical protein
VGSEPICGNDKGLSPEGDTMRQLIELNSRRIVNDAIFNSAKYLNELRLEVALGKLGPSAAQAVEYTDVAWQVADYLDSLLNKAPWRPPD